MATTNARRTTQSPQKARYWLLTIHTGSNEWKPFEKLPEEIQWCRGQKEIGANTGAEHWQVVVAFKKAVRMATVKRHFGECHCEVSRSNAANDYVWKEETAVKGSKFEIGEKALKRNNKEDWQKIKDIAKQGGVAQLLEEYPEITIRHYSTFKHIARDFMQKPEDLPNVCGVWIYGPPGVGKSYFVRDWHNDIYDKMLNKWWDGYTGQSTALLDDFDHHHKVLGSHLKRWADRYSFLAESKGHAMNIRPKFIVVTSNYKIEDIWAGDDEMIGALKRRFYNIFIPFKRG